MVTMHPDFFTGTFYAMRTKFKKKYKLLTSDQADYFMESMFLLSMQGGLCFFIWQQPSFYEKISNSPSDFGFNMCLFFVALTCHFTFAATIRNGIQMIKFVVFHHEEFKNPMLAFSLGMIIVLVNIMCEITNLVYLGTQPNLDQVISKFVGFKILIQMQDYYMRQRASFRIKNAIDKNPLVIKTDLTKVFGDASTQSNDSKSK